MSVDPLNAPSSAARACRWQAHSAAKLGSPFAAEFLHRVATDITAHGPTRALFEPWATASDEQLIAAAAPLRAMAAVHDLALEGIEPHLSSHFPMPGHATDWSALWPAVLASIESHRDRLQAFISHEPQTNEVGRSACLLGGYLTVADAVRLPLRCLEIGASAGLNLNWYRYRYALGAGLWGPDTARLLINVDWTGPLPPLDAPVDVVECAGCDRRPVDLRRPDERLRLLAYGWADQFERLERLHKALVIAEESLVVVEPDDAASWLARRANPTDRLATIVVHSVVWQYLPEATRDRIRSLLTSAGARAKPHAPLAWLRMEPPDPTSQMEVLLTTWPGGETRQLAIVHPHGAFVRWYG